MSIDALVDKIEGLLKSKRALLNGVKADLATATMAESISLSSTKQFLTIVISDLDALYADALSVKAGLHECAAQLPALSVPTGPMFKITMTEYDWGAQHEMGTKIVFSEEEAKQFCNNYAGGSPDCYYRSSYERVL
jgi:hypothetical protein